LKALLLKEKERDEKAQLRNAQADCQKWSRELNQEMSVNTNALYDAKKVRWILTKKKSVKVFLVVVTNKCFFFQNTEDEMASIKLQFEPLVQEKNSIDAQNQGYLAEITEIRKKISDSTEIRTQLRVSVFFLFVGDVR